MMKSPLMRARYIRKRLLEMLEEIRSIRLNIVASQEELVSLQNALANSNRQIGALDETLVRIEAGLQTGQLNQHEMHATLYETHHELQRQGRVLELLYEEETYNLRELLKLRRSQSYARAFDDPAPLISVVIPTYLNHELLVTRAIPSALGQTYPNIEVVVVGDGAPETTGRAIETLNDTRVRYENLTVRPSYPDDPAEFWSVAGTGPWNAAWELSRGMWIAPLNDDDSFRPEHIELLLAAARTHRSEVSYGAIAQHHPDGTTQILNSWPPELGGFGWQAALVHAELGFMPMQFGSGALRTPGDWSLCRRMRRAGVSFANIDDLVVDYYPSRLWNQEQKLSET
jgi:Glycosyl transferase family 2